MAGPQLPAVRRRKSRWILLCASLLIVCAAWPTSYAEAATPSVTATWVTDVTATSANLRALVDPGEFATTYRFEYLTETAFQANLAANPPRDGFVGAARMPAGVESPVISTSVPAFQHLSSLPSSTTFRYRVVAAFGSPRETVPGPSRAFTTEGSTLPPTLLTAVAGSWRHRLTKPVARSKGRPRTSVAASSRPPQAAAP